MGGSAEIRVKSSIIIRIIIYKSVNAVSHEKLFSLVHLKNNIEKNVNMKESYSHLIIFIWSKDILFESNKFCFV